MADTTKSKMGIFATICLFNAFGCVLSHPVFPYDIVDLSRNHGKDSLYHPILHGFHKKVELTGISSFGMWIYANTINSTEHIGTHMDAPSHFNEHGWHMHQIPLSNLIGPGVIINVKEKAEKNHDYSVSVDDIKEWEKKYGEIPDGAIVIMNSGWEKNYPDKHKVYGSDNLFNFSSFHHPGFSEEAIRWIINNRKMNMIGTDCPSFDTGKSMSLPVHVITAKENIGGLENVANLDKIPPSGTILSAAGVKTIEGSGTPVRLYAMIPRSNASYLVYSWIVLVAVILILVM